MRHSDSIAKLALALVKAHAEVENATKNADNPFFKSRYADLSELLRVSKPVLTANGLAVVQMPSVVEGCAALESIIVHESGEWIAETASAPLAPKETKDGPKPADAQTLGSAITYLRRYSLAAIMGITQEDDDGNAASNPGTHAAQPKAAAPRQAPAAPTGEMIPCPKCAGEMWDNRKDKKNPKGPDLKCKAKECGEAIWLDGWSNDLLKEIVAAHDVEAIDAAERDRAEKAVATLVPSKMAAVRVWLTELAQGAGA